MLCFSLPSQCFFWHIFMQCIAGSLLDQMIFIYVFSFGCCPGARWILHHCLVEFQHCATGCVPAGQDHGTKQLVRTGLRGAAMSCWWFGLTAWGVDGNRYHTDPYVFHNCVNLGASFSGKICQVFWNVLELWATDFVIWLLVVFTRAQPWLQCNVGTNSKHNIMPPHEKWQDETRGPEQPGFFHRVNVGMLQMGTNKVAHGFPTWLPYAKHPGERKLLFDKMMQLGLPKLESIKVKFSIVCANVCDIHRYRCFPILDWLSRSTNISWGNNSSPFCCSFCKRSCATPVYSF